ncbi:MAG: VCBS repeat-containing protein, partial [Bacteroidia bacterium]|nr:VCBS repeat-containing protein [Bacteroidia bacterium]
MFRYRNIGFKCSVLFAIAAFSITCKNKDKGTDQKIFELLDPASTGINFVNSIPENDTLNQFTYHYLFNGNGVAAGDLNNDGLPELIFTGNAVPSKLYLNKGDFKFEDITAKAGFNTNGWMSGITLADVNNDGYSDIYICKSGPENNLEAKRNLLFINNKNLTFTEKAAEYGLNDPGNATQATFFDYDNDGDLDMYLGNHADRFWSDINVPFTRKVHMDVHNQQHLFRNDGAKFTDVSEESGVIAMGYCLSVNAADFNRDGFTDLYVSNDYHIPDYYYLNNGDGTFTESFNAHFKHASTNSMGSDAADYNNDGWLDLITLDMLAENPKRFMELGGPKDYDFIQLALKNGYGHQYMHNSLQTNTGYGNFSDLAFLTGTARTDWSWSPLFADYDNDGLTDLFITNGYYRDVTNQDFQLFANRKLQQTGKYAVHKEILEKLPFERLSNFAFKNSGNYKFENVAEAWGLDEPTLGTGSAYADLNNDGRLELILCNQGDAAQIYKNVGENGNWIKLKFKGAKNNINGIGCKVIAELESGKRLCEMQGTHGYQSCSENFIHIGLGAQESVKSITVIWPGGAFETVKDAKANQTLILDEKKASGKYSFTDERVFTFEELTGKNGLDFVHVDGENPDFKREPLLPHRFTRLGPGAASGDVNGDGLADVIITNARESAGCKLYMQTADGNFKAAGSQPWAGAFEADVLGCLIFDADADGDKDIYLASGGSEFQWPSDKYKHRLYINSGTGTFTEKADALTGINCSGSCATAGDYDNDGDLDLFVAGRIMPGNYPNLD